MAAAATAEARIASMPGRWARQGFESLAAAVKIVSDLTAQELALGIGMIRERVSTRPGGTIVAMGGRAINAVIDAEKIVLDLAAEETTLAVEAVKEGFRLRPSIAAMADLIPKSVETFVGMGKSFLTDTAERTQEVTEAYTGGKPLMIADKVASFTKQRIECFVDAQKQMLDHVAEQVTLATEGGTEPEKPPRERIQVFISSTREGVDKFIDAERKIVHLALSNVEAKPRERKASPRTSFAELTQKSVQNITTAEKSLLDLAIKPIRGNHPATAPEEKAAPRRPRRKKA